MVTPCRPETATSSHTSDFNRMPYQRNICKRNKLWGDFDAWIEEDPAKRRIKFEVVKSAMLLHCSYTTVVINRIHNKTPMLMGESPEEEYANFMNIASNSKFAVGDDSEPIKNVVDVLGLLFSAIPEYSQEAGDLCDDIKTNLQLLLADGLFWDELPFSPDLFRSVFWHLVFTFELEKEDLEERPNRAELTFSAFVAAILVAIFNENELTIGQAIPKYDCAETVTDFLERMIASPYFRNLSIFFIVGFWKVVKYRVEGGMVTKSSNFVYRAESRPTASKFNELDVGLVVNAQVLASIQREWENRACDFWKNDLLKAPDGLRVSKKPRKYNKKKVEELSQVDESEIFKKPANRDRVEKISPRKKIRKSVEVFSGPIAPPPPTKAVKTVIPKPEDVGLEKPIFIIQKELIESLRKEMVRRRDHNSSDPPLNVEKFFNKNYKKAHRIERRTRLAGPQILTPEQLLVQNEFKRQYNGAEQEAEQSLGQYIPLVQPQRAPSSTSSSKPPRKVKRRY